MQAHLDTEVVLGEPRHYNYATSVLRDNLQDYDITRAKLVSYTIYDHPLHSSLH
jgi:hypothetical protein